MKDKEIDSLFAAARDNNPIDSSPTAGFERRVRSRIRAAEEEDRTDSWFVLRVAGAVAVTTVVFAVAGTLGMDPEAGSDVAAFAQFFEEAVSSENGGVFR